MALDSTVAGPNAVSYASVTEADDYFRSHWNTSFTESWKELRLPQKEGLLASATRVLETLPVLDLESEVVELLLPFPFRDDAIRILVTRFSVGQALQFPRNVDSNGDGTATIPMSAKEALFMQALYMKTFDDSALAAQLQGIREDAFTAGSVKGYTVYSGTGSMLSPHALTLMRQHIRQSTNRRIHRA